MAMLKAAENAANDGGYARQEVLRPRNESVYVKSNCWKMQSFENCKACLDNASASLMGCLPWSQGRVLHIGCFMRYSDQNFLNNERGRRPRGRVLHIGCFMRYSDQNFLNNERGGRPRVSLVAMVVGLMSSVVVGILIGIYLWKSRRIRKKRRGPNNTTRMAKTLFKSSLNFKYSTLEHATKSFDITNKLGQVEFGTIYKVTHLFCRPDQCRSIFGFACPILFMDLLYREFWQMEERLQLRGFL